LIPNSSRSYFERRFNRSKSLCRATRQFAAQAILDRGYGKPTQSIDANIEDVGGAVGFYALVPRPAATTEEGLAGNPVATQRNTKATLITGAVASVNDEQTH
jgi:hypothetical protein